jgi:hypothetical protein
MRTPRSRIVDRDAALVVVALVEEYLRAIGIRLPMAQLVTIFLGKYWLVFGLIPTWLCTTIDAVVPRTFVRVCVRAPWCVMIRRRASREVFTFIVKLVHAAVCRDPLTPFLVGLHRYPRPDQVWKVGAAIS